MRRRTIDAWTQGDIDVASAAHADVMIALILKANDDIIRLMSAKVDQ